MGLRRRRSALPVSAVRWLLQAEPPSRSPTWSPATESAVGCRLRRAGHSGPTSEGADSDVFGPAGSTWRPDERQP